MTNEWEVTMADSGGGESGMRSGLSARLWVVAAAALIGFVAVYVVLRPVDNATLRTKPDDTAKPSAQAAMPAPVGSAAAPTTGTLRNPLAKGEMAAFVFRKEPVAPAPVRFLDASGKEIGLEAFKGRTVLLNLWATWCAPCRKEMPGLDRLQKVLGSDTFEVVALSVDRKGLEGAKAFLAQIKTEHLAVYADPAAKVGNELKAIGMPATLLIDPQGREIGRLVGPAEWDSADAIELVKASIAGK